MGMACYAGSPLYPSANVVIRNLKIKHFVYQSDRVVFDQRQIEPFKNNKLTTIDITDNMYFSMDIEVKSFPSNWASVFQCGNSDLQRMPALFLNPNKKIYGWFHEASAGQTPVTSVGQTYKLEIIATQSTLVFRMDGKDFVNQQKSPHHPRPSIPCYAGSPWRPSANVVIRNLVIKQLGIHFGQANAMNVIENIDDGSTPIEVNDDSDLNDDMMDKPLFDDGSYSIFGSKYFAYLLFLCASIPLLVCLAFNGYKWFLGCSKNRNYAKVNELMEESDGGDEEIMDQ